MTHKEMGGGGGLCMYVNGVCQRIAFLNYEKDCAI